LDIFIFIFIFKGINPKNLFIMKKIMLLLMGFLVFFSCSEDNADTLQKQSIEKNLDLESSDPSPSSDRFASCDYVTDITVSDLGDLSAEESTIIEHFNRNALFDGLSNYSEIIYVYNDTNGKEFIEAIADNEESGLTTLRVEVQSQEVESQSASSRFMISLSMSADTCSGVNCSKCSFTKDGGCKCDKIGSINGGASYCNHSTSC